MLDTRTTTKYATSILHPHPRSVCREDLFALWFLFSRSKEHETIWDWHAYVCACVCVREGEGGGGYWWDLFARVYRRVLLPPPSLASRLPRPECGRAAVIRMLAAPPRPHACERAQCYSSCATASSSYAHRIFSCTRAQRRPVVWWDVCTALLVAAACFPLICHLKAAVLRVQSRSPRLPRFLYAFVAASLSVWQLLVVERQKRKRKKDKTHTYKNKNLKFQWSLTWHLQFKFCFCHLTDINGKKKPEGGLYLGGVKKHTHTLGENDVCWPAQCAGQHQKELSRAIILDFTLRLWSVNTHTAQTHLNNVRKQRDGILFLFFFWTKKRHSVVTADCTAVLLPHKGKNKVAFVVATVKLICFLFFFKKSSQLFQFQSHPAALLLLSVPLPLYW